MSSRERSVDRSRSRSNGRDDRRRERSRSRSASRGRPLGGREYKPSEGPTEPSKCVGCFGMNFDTTEETLTREFERYGEVVKCVIIQDKGTQQSRGYGFITFRNLDDAIEARDKMNGVSIDRREVRVDYSKTTRAHTPTPGQYYGKKSDAYNSKYRDDGGRGYGGGRGRDDRYRRSSRDRYRDDRRDDRRDGGRYRDDRNDRYRDDRRRDDRYRQRSRSPRRSPYRSRRSVSPRYR